MSNINTIHQESLILGLAITELYPQCSSNRFYEEYDEFVGGILNQFYDFVLKHPNQKTIHYELKIYE